LTVDAGSLSLALPTLADATGSEPVPEFSPAPVDEDDHDPSGDRATVWRIDHDVLGRETRAFVDHGTSYDAEHGSRVEEHYTGEVAVSTDDPGVARATATSRFAIAWPEVRVHSEARLDVRSDAEAFDVTVELDVHEDDELVRTRSWSRRIPRRLQ
jgi:hypothetical protein